MQLFLLKCKIVFLLPVHVLLYYYHVQVYICHIWGYTILIHNVNEHVHVYMCMQSNACVYVDGLVKDQAMELVNIGLYLWIVFTPLETAWDYWSPVCPDEVQQHSLWIYLH